MKRSPSGSADPTCTCGYAAGMRRQIVKLVDEGKSEDQIIQAFLDEYRSQEPLAAPLNKGFYRLSWLLPFAIGGVGAVIAGSMALRWSGK